MNGIKLETEIDQVHWEVCPCSLNKSDLLGKVSQVTCPHCLEEIRIIHLLNPNVILSKAYYTAREIVVKCCDVFVALQEIYYPSLGFNFLNKQLNTIEATLGKCQANLQGCKEIDLYYSMSGSQWLELYKSTLANDPSTQRIQRSNYKHHNQLLYYWGNLRKACA